MLHPAPTTHATACTCTCSMMRSNLVKLMSGPSPESEAAGDTKNGGDNAGDEKRRRLIVDLEPPRFGRFTGLLDVPGTLLGWAGDRYGGSNSSDNNRRKGSPDGECLGRGGGDAEEKFHVCFGASLLS